MIKKEISKVLGVKKCPELSFVADNSIERSAEITRRLKTLVPEEDKENREDNAAEITAKVREMLLESPKLFAEKRLFNAYPKLQTIRIKVKEKIEQTKEEIDQRLDQTKELIDDTIDRTKEELNKRIKNKRK